MIRSFRDKDALALFEGQSVRRYRAIEKQAQNRLQYLDAATTLADLAARPSNRFERLSGSRKGRRSIRINDQWRRVFRWTDEGAEDVEIVDYH
ncbi:MAG TPA: type II toxin-antitoxin system RelE/ParE family toxin [Acidiferrobacterales bacterium]|jgi:proteic killer suppression protein